MFLKSLELIGFKSFADKTKISFTDGIISLLGPNGCGKSNIVDAIKWVLGEQSSKTLRAGKMEDVIFNGSDTKMAANAAEVSLILDNSQLLLPIDLAEIEIKRRVFRSGESEYYINRKRCLLKNIKDLFFDTGVGKSAYSILEQGKIDQILSQKPEDRRYIFEEAAGISRYKVESNEAKRKLERFEENINQVEMLAKSEKRRYDSLKVQAEKALLYSDLIKKQLELDARVHICKINTFLDVIEIRNNKNIENQENIKNLKDNLDELLAVLEDEENKLKEENKKSFDLQHAINSKEENIKTINIKIELLEKQYREYLSSQNQVKIRQESYSSLILRDKTELDENMMMLSDHEEKLEENLEHLNNAKEYLGIYQKELDDINLDINNENNNIYNFYNKLDLLSNEIKQVIESIVNELDKNTKGINFDDISQSIVANLEEIKGLLKLKLDYYSSTTQTNSFKLKDDFLLIYDKFSTFEEEYSNFISPLISLVSSNGLMYKKRMIEENENLYKQKIENSKNKIEDNKIKLEEIGNKIISFNEMIKNMEINLEVSKKSIESYKAIIINIERNIEEKENSLSECNNELLMLDDKINESINSLHIADSEKNNLLKDICDIKKDLSLHQDCLKEKYLSLKYKEEEKSNLIKNINDKKNDIEKNELLNMTINEKIQDLYLSFFNSYNRPLKDYEIDEEIKQDQAESDLALVKDQLLSLGTNINHMAAEDFKESEERFKFYDKELKDCYKAKDDLEKVLQEIIEESEKLFLETYKNISNNFQIMFKRLFGGGKAEITLEDSDNLLTSGINIFAQPPGKKMINLSLLSGGERSMTAVALLFATYLVKPSPFCILDEIDAALDDKNIGYFLDVLTEFSKSSQFIIITHNKHTVSGSTTLLGVTQLVAGISSVVSYKLANIKNKQVILNEDDIEVDIEK